MYAPLVVSSIFDIFNKALTCKKVSNISVIGTEVLRRGRQAEAMHRVPITLILDTFARVNVYIHLYTKY